MKRILSLLLSVILLLTTIIVAVPASATDTGSIEATPITDWLNNTNGNATKTETYPLGYVNAKGIKISASSVVETTNVDSSTAYTGVYWRDDDGNKVTISFADGTHFMMYVELEAGNRFLPKIFCDFGFSSYDPALTLKAGSSYSYMALGDTAWTTTEAVYCGAGESGSFGYGMSFDNAFKGYVKFALSDLASGDGAYNANRIISEIRVYFEGIGGDYGSAVTGPFFLITSDSNSADIIIPEIYKPEPIQATPLNWTSAASANGSVNVTATKMPLGYTTAEGIVCSQAWNYAGQYTANAVRFWYIFDESKSLDDFIVYVDIPKANKIKIVLCESDGNPWNTVIANSSYKKLSLEGTAWEDATVSANNEIVFDEAFNGYLKFNNSVNFNNTQGFTHFLVYIEGVGESTASDSTVVDYGSPVIGPIFEITEDSNSTKIEVPEAYKPQPIQATPLNDWASVVGVSGINVSARKQPLSYVSAEGIVVSLSTPMETPETINDLRFYIDFNSSVTATDIVMYVDIPSANILQMRNGSDWTWLKSGTAYQYAASGDDGWTDATVGALGIEFDSAFEGYIKLDRSVVYGSTSAFTRLFVAFKGLGTGTLSDGVTTVNYGSPVIGPIFEITEDSNSTKIEVPAAYQPKEIQVTAISDWYHNNYGDFAAAGLDGNTWSSYTDAPLDFTSAIGDSLNISNNTVYEFDPVSSSKIRTYVTLNKGVDLTVAESLIVYVNIPAANTLLFNFRTDTAGSYVRSMTLKADGTGTYYIAAKDATEWTEKTAVYCGDTSASNQTYTGGMVFEGAFEGYIKIPVTSIGCADEALVSVKQGLATLTNIECKFKGLSNVYGNDAVVGPYFLATTDSTSTELKLNKLEGDINLDSYADANDLVALREYIIGTDNAYVTAGGNLNGDADGNIDICDLVYMSGIEDDIIFSNNSYYRTADEGINGEIRSISAYVYMPENNIKESARGGVILGNYGLAGNCLNFEIHQSGKPRLYSVNGNGQGIDLIFDGDVRADGYTHLVITVDDTNKTAACYINGSLVEELSFTNDFDLTVNQLQFMLGGDYRTNNSNYLKGKLGEVSLFGDTLTADDVAAIYSGNSAAAVDNITALWSVGSAKEAYIIDDESNNGNYLNPYTTFFYNETEDIERAYSFAVVGDTQSMASSYSGKFDGIYDWILENQSEKNIQHVFGLGDIVDNDTSDAQWETAVNAINKMNGKISYSLVRGNHDSQDNMNKYFANETYMSQFDGFYKEGDVNNVYQFFTIGETKYLFMTLEYLHDSDVSESLPGQPLSAEEQDNIIAWAKGVIDANSDCKVIISTHYYVDADGSVTDVNDIESEIVAKCPNVCLVLGGHIISDNIVQGNTTTYDIDGVSHKVNSLLIDPQGSDLSYNGLGMVAMLYFNEDGSQIEVEYYSTVRDQYFLRDNQFVLDAE